MAGHSEWQNRKYRKRKVDRKRAKKFNRLSRKIIRAAREGGGDPETNLDLKWAIEEARDEDMPRENIERAIKRGTGELNREEGEAARYEGYGPGGVAVLVQAYTDNRNRTHADLRQIFNEHDGSLTEEGSVAHLFEERCKFAVKNGSCTEDELLELIIEAGGEEIQKKGESYVISGSAERFNDIRSRLQQEELEIQDSNVIPEAKTEVSPGEEERELIDELKAELEENLDVQSVYTNLPDTSGGFEE